MKGAAAGAVATVLVARPGVASAAPPDVGSVKPEHFHTDAVDPASNVPGARTLGTGSQQAAPGTLADEVATKETPAGAEAKISAALLSMPEVVEGTNIAITEQSGDTSMISVVPNPVFQLDNSSNIALKNHGDQILALEVTDGEDASPSVRLMGRLAGSLFGGGGAIQFGPGGSQEPYATMLSVGENQIAIANGGQLISNSPRVDSSSAAVTAGGEHRSATLCCDNGSGTTVTFTALGAHGLSVGSHGDIVQVGAGQVQVAGSGGVVIRSFDGKNKTAGQWATISWWVASATEVVLSGDLVS